MPLGRWGHFPMRAVLSGYALALTYASSLNLPLGRFSDAVGLKARMLVNVEKATATAL